VRKLGERSYPGVSYAGDIADLERYGFTHDALDLGNTVRVMDEGIALDVSTRIIRLVRNLVNRMDVQVELANRAKTILDKTQFAKDPRWRQHFY
jgi:phage minor structural protein